MIIFLPLSMYISLQIDKHHVSKFAYILQYQQSNIQ